MSIIGVTDSTGNLLFSSEAPTGTVINVSDRDYFIQARDGRDPELIATGPIQDRINGIWSMLCSPAASQQPTAVLAG